MTASNPTDGMGNPTNLVVLGDPGNQIGSEREVDLSIGFVGLEIEGRTLFVDKLAGPNADGSLGNPFNNIARAGAQFAAVW